MPSAHINLLSVSVLAILLTGCGGGGGGDDDNKAAAPSTNKSVESTKTTNTTDEIVEITEEAGDETTKTITTTPVVEKEQDSPVISTPKKPATNANFSKSEITVYNRLNTRRNACGFGSLAYDEQLQLAAKNHADYLLHMSKNSSVAFQGHNEEQVDNYSGIKNPYYTGKSVDYRINTRSNEMGVKAVPVSYEYRTLTENLSFLSFNKAYLDQTNDNEIALSSINGLLAAPYHMATLLSPSFNEIGISYGREILKTPLNAQTDVTYGSVLEMVMGSPKGSDRTKVDKVISYPCDNVTGTQYELKHESPNPFKDTNRDLAENPIGQPIYILAQNATTINVTDYKMTDAAGKAVDLKALTHANDVNSILKSNQVILMPLMALQPKQSYKVTYKVSVDGGITETKTFIFTTKA